MSFRRFILDETGKKQVIFESDPAKPFELRRPRNSTAHAPVRRFAKGKPRYRRFRGLLVMALKTAR
jgi:hypothetical protein